MTTPVQVQVGARHRDRRRPRPWPARPGSDRSRSPGPTAGSERSPPGTRSCWPPARTAAVPDIPGLRDALPVDLARRHQPARGPEPRMAVIGGGVVACESARWLDRPRRRRADDRRVARGCSPGTSRSPANWSGRRSSGTACGSSSAPRVDTVGRRDPRTTGEGRVHGGEVTVSFGDANGHRRRDRRRRRPDAAQHGHRPGRRSGSTSARPAASSHRRSLAVLGVPGEWLYAVGDITGRALLTHMGKYQARICGAVIAARAEGQPTGCVSIHRRRGRRQRPAGDLHRPAGRLGRAHRAAGPGRRRRRGDGRVRHGRARRLLAPAGRLRRAARSSSSTGPPTPCSARPSSGADVAELVHAATVAVVGRGDAGSALARRAVVPDGERDLAAAAGNAAAAARRSS